MKVMKKEDFRRLADQISESAQKKPSPALLAKQKRLLKKLAEDNTEGLRDVSPSPSEAARQRHKVKQQSAAIHEEIVRAAFPSGTVSTGQ